jgi:hypothetical protein
MKRELDFADSDPLKPVTEGLRKKRMTLKWVIKKGQNPEHRDDTVDLLCKIPTEDSGWNTEASVLTF